MAPMLWYGKPGGDYDDRSDGVAFVNRGDSNGGGNYVIVSYIVTDKPSDSLS